MESTINIQESDNAALTAMPMPGQILRIREEAFERPVFILTADLDWASDYCINTLVSFAHERNITPTLFVTHNSQAIAALRAKRRVECGIHPNFLPGSTHGKEPGDVIAHLLSIVPHPVATRCHHYLDSSELTHSLVASGLRVDSNICLFLQPALRPLLHCSGLMRLPCFWEDDAHWERGFAWNFARLRTAFFTPGLSNVRLRTCMYIFRAAFAL